MGRRGPQRTPTSILARRGSWLAGRRLEPPREVGAIRCPKWLVGEGRKVFRGIVARLRFMGILGNADANAIARYSRLWERWLESEKKADVERSMRLSRHLLQLEREFGLTPGARANLASEAPDTRSRVKDNIRDFDIA